MMATNGRYSKDAFERNVARVLHDITTEPAFPNVETCLFCYEPRTPQSGAYCLEHFTEVHRWKRGGLSLERR